MVNLKKLKALRAYHGLSQEELEMQAGLDFRTYSNKERGRVRFTLEDTIKLARYYKMSMAEYNEIFLNGELK